jgi:hypothetical protein
MRISAHPLGSSSPIVRFTLPGDGRSYPSTINLPSPGCWHLDVAVGNLNTMMDLVVDE